ncbi:hypothetical protein [Mycoplasma leachii]|uniref:hypothetical protein n=1 Tax=Mycoplasma leachii TaxID=2105 RepID=UPI003DA44460
MPKNILSNQYSYHQNSSKEIKTKKVCISLSKSTVELEEKLFKNVKESKTGITFNRSKIYHNALLELLKDFDKKN